MRDQKTFGGLEIQSARNSEGHQDRFKHIAVVEPWYGRRTYQDRERGYCGELRKSIVKLVSCFKVCHDSDASMLPGSGRVSSLGMSRHWSSIIDRLGWPDPVVLLVINSGEGKRVEQAEVVIVFVHRPRFISVCPRQSRSRSRGESGGEGTEP